jgi:hypothetical protein
VEERRAGLAALLALAPGLAPVADALAAAGVAQGTAEDGVVYGPAPSAAAWDDVERALLEGFRVSKAGAGADAPVVYLVSQPALLGHLGPLPAMLAAGLVSGARALGMEGARRGRRANAVAYGDDTPPEVVATWACALLQHAGPSGEVVHLAPAHHGKVRP